MNCPCLRAMLVTLPLLLLMPFGDTVAQERFQWPEDPENLEVLDPDISTRDLGRTMGLFMRWLGADDCSVCHVGEAGQPLITYDFPSDDNPRKERAREMLRMVRSINERIAAVDFGDREPMSVNCGTCHSGRVRPVPLSTVLVDTYEAEGLDAAIMRYRELKARYHGRGAYDFASDRQLNLAGYRLLDDEQLEDAIALFRLAVEEHPRSANAYDSLAEAYLAAGELERAEILYGKAVELDPGNRHSFEQLIEVRRRLETGEAEGGAP